MPETALLGGTPIRQTPFPTWPISGQEEIDAATRAIKSGRWGWGHEKAEGGTFEEDYARFQNAKHGTLVHAGTTGIRIALQALDLKMGDEVIVPAYTFIGTVIPVMDLGAIPVFVDVQPDTYNISPVAIEAAITSKTVGIIPVHFAGMPANLGAIQAIAEKRGLWVMEDAAQAWGAQWEGVGVGHIGNAGMFSFQSSKNITAGEGGIVLTDDDALNERIRSFVNCGRTTDGEWYEHHVQAGNYRLNEISAAILRAQFARYPEQLAHRQKMAAYLSDKLGAIDGLTPMTIPEQVTSHAWHLYIFRYDPQPLGGLPREIFIHAMQKEGIPVSQGYMMPLYEQPVFKNKQFDPSHAAQSVDFAGVNCPVAKNACDSEAIWLRQEILMGNEEDMDDIAMSAVKLRANVKELLDSRLATLEW
jgi:dTDP-4-amino-4,6-dideoxygalactose transaminase